MIVFDLDCDQGHVFEAWFKDGAAFEIQRVAKAVSCPLCGSVEVRKGIQATNIASGVSREKTAKVAERQAEAMVALRQIRAEVEKNCDYVGTRFAEEARKIHHGEIAQRSIYGEATLEDAKALDEEGVGVTSIPWINREDA